MGVNVIHLLPATWPGVDDRAETGVAAGVRHAQLVSKPRRQAQHSTKQRCIGFGAARQRLNMFTRGHEHMDGCGRVDIVKSNKFIVFMDFLARNFSRSDLAENAVLLAHVCRVISRYECKLRIKRSASNPGTRLQGLVLVQEQPALYNAIKCPDSDHEQNGEADKHPDQRYADHMTE